jgi:hypothetical protein
VLSSSKSEMNTINLDETIFHSYFIEPMLDVTESAEPKLDIWPYAQAIPIADLEGHEIWEDFVEYVYRTENNHYEHILVCTKTSDVYLVIVIDNKQNIIIGHRLMNFKKLFGFF